MIGQFVPLLVFSFAMALAALNDVTTLRIPNNIPLAMVVGFLFCVSITTPPLGVIASHVAVGATLFAVCFVMFALGWIGGGDGKLIAAGGLWFSWGGATISYLYCIALAGGAMCIVIFLFRKFPIPVTLHRVEWLDRLHQPKAGVPYGVAIACGGLAAYPQSGFYSGF